MVKEAYRLQLADWTPLIGLACYQARINHYERDYDSRCMRNDQNRTDTFPMYQADENPCRKRVQVLKQYNLALLIIGIGLYALTKKN